MPAPLQLDADRAAHRDPGLGRWWLALLAVWLVSAVYVWHYLPHGWVPHDEGTLAQSAQRVLAGQLPHRDFTEIYTGGLSYLDAAAFRVMGENLRSLRLALYACFLAWVPALYYIATRFVRPLTAGAVVALAVAWSLPNYSAAMPSWYNLFFATFGLAALVRHLESPQRRWLVLAGACGGLSCLIKIVGLYYIAAVLLYLVYHEQTTARTEPPTTSNATSRRYSVFLTAALACFVAALVRLVRGRLGLPELVHFVVPGAAVAALVLWQEWRTPAGRDGRRFRTLIQLAAPFLLGACIPIALFLVPYIRSGALGALIDGVFITPMERLQFAAVSPPGGSRLLIAIPTAACLGLVPSWRPKLNRFVVAGIIVALCAMLATTESRFYQLVWHSMRVLGPVIVVAGVWLVARYESIISPRQRLPLVLLLAAAAMCALVQYPFSAPVYFFYVAPLIALAGLAVITSQPRMPRIAPMAGLAFYLLFAVIRIHPGFIYQMGIAPGRDDQTVPIGGDRGGVLVTAADDRMYTQLIALLRQHATGGWTYATPDCPEVYFLSGLRNPTRVIFDFFDQAPGRTTRILHTLDTRHITAIVLNQSPSFSGPVPADLRRALEIRYPRNERIGHFVVRWRE